MWQPLSMLSSGFGTSTMPDSELILDEAVAQVDKISPHVDVTTRALPAPVAGAFVDASLDAVVVGALGHRRSPGDFGSTTWQVAIHAFCPVVVVREAPEEGPRTSIVVGVDGSAHSALALDYAFQRAAAQKVDLVAVHGWQFERLDQFYAALGRPARRDMLEESRAAQLDGWLRPIVARYPRVRVRRVSAREQAGAALLRESQSAELVVVGSRGRGGFRGLLLGSVGMELLRNAACSVAIVRA